MNAGHARKLRDALVTVLEGIQYGGEPAFVAVQTDTSMEFEGYPSVKVLPNQQTSVRETSGSFEHTVSFAAIIHWLLQDPETIEADLYNQMLDLSDLVQDTVEHTDFENTLEGEDPTIGIYFVEVPQSNWQVAVGKPGAFLMANLVIEFKYSKNAA